MLYLAAIFDIVRELVQANTGTAGENKTSSGIDNNIIPGIMMQTSVG
jgi:hypothetical protein